MKAKTLALCLSLLCACLVGALCSELIAGKKPGTLLEAAKAVRPPDRIKVKPDKSGFATRVLWIVDNNDVPRIMLTAAGKRPTIKFLDDKGNQIFAIWSFQGKTWLDLGADVPDIPLKMLPPATRAPTEPVAAVIDRRRLIRAVEEIGKQLKKANSLTPIPRARQ